MNWIKVLLLIATLTFSNAQTPVGSWIFDTKASVKKHKEFARIYSRLEGMQIVLNNSHVYQIPHKGSGKCSKTGNFYVLKAKNGKKMRAHLTKEGLLHITQPTSRGNIELYFKKGSLKVGAISDYIYINSVYRQKNKVYDNGYLYYLFLDNGVFYSYASPKQKLSANEIKSKGDKLQYRFLGDKIVMQGPFKVTIKAYNKKKIVTSQKDILYVQK